MITLFGIVLGWPVMVGAGLVLGWVFLPQPGFITRAAQWLGIKDRTP